MYHKTVTIGSYPNQSDRLEYLVPDARFFALNITSIYSELISGATDRGTLHVDFIIADSDLVYQSNTVNLTAVSSDHYFTYQYTPDQPLIDRALIYITTTNTGNQKTRVRFNGNVEYYRESVTLAPTSSLYWAGWVQPDQLSRSYLNPSYFIQLVATDGIADLKKIDYPFDLEESVTGQTHLMSMIKTCLSPIEIDLPIKVQCNINTPVITGNVLLKKVFANPTRFVKYKDGKTTYENCYNALSSILDAFNCKMFQSDGFYHIVQKNELNSPQSTFNWSDLSLSATTTNNLGFGGLTKVQFNSDELSKVRPLRYGTINFNLGSANIVTGYNNSFTSGIAGWANGGGDGGFDTFFWDSGETRSLGMYRYYFPTYGTRPAYFESDAFTLNKDDGSVVTLTFDFRLDVTFHDRNVTPLMVIQLLDSDGEIVTTIENDTQEGQNKIVQTFTFEDTGVHRLRFLLLVRAVGDIYDLTAYFDNFRIAVNSDSDSKKYRSIEGKVYTSTAMDVFERDMVFGDGDSINNFGALRYSVSGLTSDWSNWGGSEHTSLQKLNIYNKLRNIYKFKNYLRMTLKSDQMLIGHLPLIKDKYYGITDYNFDILNNNLSVELSEHLMNNYPTIVYQINDYVGD